MIDRIEKNVQQAQDYVASAVEETKQAVTLQSKARCVRLLYAHKTNDKKSSSDLHSKSA
jgi:hypothetical protein